MVEVIVRVSVYAVCADMCAPPLFPTTKAGELHRLARGMIECDVEMPDVGLVTVAVTHLVRASIHHTVLGQSV